MLPKKTYGEWLQEATKALNKANIPSARLDALLLLEQISGKKKEILLTYPETFIGRNRLRKLNRLLKKRSEHIPLAYLVNKKEFYGRDFYVNNKVLVPRPESESFISLLEKISFAKKQKMLDLGTGSGILAITIKSLHPSWDVAATDISKKALTVARKNAKSFGLDIRFRKSNLFNSIDNDFDVITANLPYVPTTLKVLEEVMNEPSVAVFSGDDGLVLYRILLTSSFKKDAYLLLESLLTQQDEIKALAKENGFKLIDKENLVLVFKKIK